MYMYIVTCTVIMFSMNIQYRLLSNGSLDLIEEIPVSSSEVQLANQVNIVASQDKKLLFVTTVNKVCSSTIIYTIIR